MNTFHKFPSIPHLAWLGPDIPRNDKVMDAKACRTFLNEKVRIEEKVDGANLGISFDSHGAIRLQNRGSLLPQTCSGQFKSLSQWLSRHENDLFDALTDRLQLFGEWCAVVHSVEYSGLPDWFIAFDIYDIEAGRFWSTPRRDELLVNLNIHPVPEIGHAIFSLDELIQLLAARKSSLGAPQLEGFVLRRESTDWLLDRAKLVRGDFTQNIRTHWSRRLPRANRLRTCGNGER